MEVNQLLRVCEIHNIDSVAVIQCEFGMLVNRRGQQVIELVS